ncbi:MAG: hypothetical protein JST22_00370 [Bacteroidetes bacterium]|nr:hypothetical protein [Bacteroidota bacterium]
MTTRKIALNGLLLAFLCAVVAGCGSSKRTTVNGYSDAMLSGKRLAVVLPLPVDVVLTDPAAYAAVRGTVAESARDLMQDDFRSQLISALASRLDSNHVMSYRDETVGAMVPLNARSDFSSAAPISWDPIKRATQEGNLDYLLVMHSMTISTISAATTRGAESISGEYLLIDARRDTVMTSGRVETGQIPLSGPGDAYGVLAQKLAEHLPFIVGNKAH